VIGLDPTNPAVVPDPPQRKPRTYRVADTAQGVLGHGPGETFTALLDPVQERLLLDGRAIWPVDEPDPDTAADPSVVSPPSDDDATDSTPDVDPEPPAENPPGDGERVPIQKPENPSPHIPTPSRTRKEH
jgi:hypothetical protein